MSKNCYQNSISETLKPRQIVYNNDDFESYYLTADEVNAVFATGKIPLMMLDGTFENAPKIAMIWGQEKHPDRIEKDYSLHPDYVKSIIDAGGTPYFIVYDKIAEQLDMIQPDGIFLIGGVFNSPAAWYDTDVAEDVDKRGLAYLTMLDYAKAHKLPLLGICGGMQMIAGYFGAKMQKGININLPPEKSHKQNGELIVHKVLIEDDSLLSNITNKTEIMTNSSHNEAVIAEKAGNNRIIARAEDGIVEAIEPIGGWHKFILGVQWHPERLCKQGDVSSKNIFKSFIESCKNDEKSCRNR